MIEPASAGLRDGIEVVRNAYEAKARCWLAKSPSKSSVRQRKSTVNLCLSTPLHPSTDTYQSVHGLELPFPTERYSHNTELRLNSVVDMACI